MRRSIAISLSPNCEKDDISLALKLLFSPFSWFDFRQTEGLENDFKKLFGSNYQFLAVDSGRSALYLILKALGISEGDEVLLQGFTCVAVPNSVIWPGAKPVYVDVDKNFNIDIGKIKEKITEKTKAIIVQHSFGIPVDIQKVRRVVRNKRIVIIEDCALSLGAENKGKKVGTLGDISFFSFGRDKVISSVFGGMILSKNKKISKENAGSPCGSCQKPVKEIRKIQQTKKEYFQLLFQCFKNQGSAITCKNKRIYLYAVSDFKQPFNSNI